MIAFTGFNVKAQPSRETHALPEIPNRQTHESENPRPCQHTKREQGLLFPYPLLELGLAGAVELRVVFRVFRVIPAAAPEARVVLLGG
jgi:hypothetical protein